MNDLPTCATCGHVLPHHAANCFWVTGTVQSWPWRVVAAFGGPNTFAEATTERMVEVHQHEKTKRFRVVYGLQIKKDLTYAQAAREFGECVFHLQACNGVLDNSF